MKLNWKHYEDKVRACWIGKNIGGTMGAPYEGKREFLSVEGFSTQKGQVLPNDDLDLQLAWLRAVEKFGPKNITSQLLGEFWLLFITPHWNEYGIAKTNMRKGFYPPLSGEIFTTWKDSNGAWIRTEIWACLAPGAVEVATEYAYRDACVDHGTTGEGTVAAIFVAAMESAAFFEEDVRKLIEIGLSRIPCNSRVAKSIRTVIECYDKGLPYEQTRETVLRQNTDIGDGWFEAPSNVAYMTIGLLYGEGDFKKSMIYAINCGDDTDCTAATLGSILGIVGGTAAIPSDWREYIGDDIVTISLSSGALRGIPKTCEELTERVIKLAPRMLRENNADVELTCGESEKSEDYVKSLLAAKGVLRRFETEKYSYTVDCLHTRVTVVLEEEPKIKPLQTVKVKIRFEQNTLLNNGGGGDAEYFLNLRWWLPDGFTVKGERCVLMTHATAHTKPMVETEVEFTVPEKLEPLNRVVLEISSSDKMTLGYVPINLLG